MVAVKSAPITFGMEGKRRWLHIPEYLNLEIEAIKGEIRIKTVLTNPAFTVAQGYDPVIARLPNIRSKILGLNGTVPVRMVFIQSSTMGHNSRTFGSQNEVKLILNIELSISLSFTTCI